MYIAGRVTQVDGKELRKIILHSFEGIFLYINKLQEVIQSLKEEVIRYNKN